MSGAPRILSASARTPRRWKNGGGVTHEIWVHPPGAGDADFLWRASMATIDAAGRFSDWPGVDRLLVPLTGGLELSIEGQSRRLGPGDAAQAFPGEAEVSGRPLTGPCTVLNIMVRRGRMLADVPHDAHVADILPKQRLVLAREQVTVEAGGAQLVLEAGDALLLEGDALAITPHNHLIIFDFYSEPDS